MKMALFAAIMACSALVMLACNQGLNVSEKNAVPSVAGERVVREGCESSKFYFIDVFNDQFCRIQFNNGKEVTGSIIDWEVKDPTLTLTMCKEISLIRWLHALDKAGVKCTYKKGAWYNPFAFHEVYISADQLRRKY